VTALAAIDCGTNSTRLLVSENGRTLDRRMVITRLGQGVDATGRLAPEAIDRTLHCLRDYRTLMDRFGVERVRVTATSAARDADNRDAFFDAAEQVIGARPELLPGDEEGRLSFLGATAELDAADGPFLVVDIGGGSTEFVVGTTQPEGVLSVDMGCDLRDPRVPRRRAARATGCDGCGPLRRSRRHGVDGRRGGDRFARVRP
jgi:exopolyphosphatase/guanosine-5'-triphosphate,3'-diphosphate pyrophosphatase